MPQKLLETNASQQAPPAEMGKPGEEGSLRGDGGVVGALTPPGSGVQLPLPDPAGLSGSELGAPQPPSGSAGVRAPGSPPVLQATRADPALSPDPRPGPRGIARPRRSRTHTAAAPLTSAPGRWAGESLGCGAGTVRGARCGGESSLLAANPGVEPSAPSGAALPSLPALAAAGKTWRAGVRAAGSLAAGRGGRSGKGRGAGGGDAAGDERGGGDAPEARSPRAAEPGMLSAGRGRRALGRSSCPARPRGGSPRSPAREVSKGHLAGFSGRRRLSAGFPCRDVGVVLFSGQGYAEAMSPPFTTRVSGHEEARPSWKWLPSPQLQTSG
ncbi:collagen alpha-1(III) chain-like [Pan paniscus]|uniref:collagen alpha-1(III) chain-like n=1 Tax=Pan paniscus TaxID=9597 RepID=UPI002436B38F|nr:collagen alpha-1(III) chain-like [Pan paniscus]